MNLVEYAAARADGRATVVRLRSAKTTKELKLRGVQLGCYFLCGVNVTDTLDGVQAGIVNYAEHVKGGCQIGLVNIIKQGGWMPVFPFLNGNF